MGQCFSGRNEPSLPGPGPEEWPAGVRYQPYHDRSEVSTLQSKIDVLQSELAQLKANAKKTREAKDAEIKRLSDKIAQLKADAQKARQEKEWAEGTLNESQRQLAESKARLKSLNDDYVPLNDYTSLKDAHDKLKAQAQQLRHLNDQLHLDSRDSKAQVLSGTFPLRHELLDEWKTWIESSGADEFAVENPGQIVRLHGLIQEAGERAVSILQERQAAMLKTLGVDESNKVASSLAWVSQALRDTYSIWSQDIDASSIDSNFHDILEGEEAGKTLVKISLGLMLSKPRLEFSVPTENHHQYDSAQHQQLEFLDIPAQPEGKTFVEALPGICEAEGANELLFGSQYVFLEE